MEWVEISAKTVEEAKAVALDELGIDEADAEFEVLEEPRLGLFRQVRGSARVRARVAPRVPRAKAERRGRRPKSEERASTEPRSATKKTTAAGNQRAATPGTAKVRGGETKKSKSPAAPTPAKAVPRQKKEDPAMTMTLDQQVEAAETFLNGLLDAFGVEGVISTERTDEKNATVNITGSDLGFLIGVRGHTMNAVQDLTRIALQKQASGSWEGHVHVDVGGYRAQRRTALVQFVTSVAKEVAESGKPKALEPMSSSDRKIVHDTVNEIDGVHTTSEGHEPKRWVMIAPGND